MSLRKKPTITAERIAASQANGRHWRGPSTAKRREAIHTALLRHGFSAPAEEEAMRALGEDPAQFQELLEELWRTYQPGDAAQEGLVIRLARATWLQNRADRMQEGYAVRQARDLNSGRQERLHAQMMRLKMTAESLQRLIQSVAREHYVTTPEDLEKMKNLRQEGVLKDMGDIALALFYQLQAPGTGEDGLDPMEKARRMVEQAKEIFGIGKTAPYPPRSTIASDASRIEQDPQYAEAGEEEDDERYPNISAAEWEARERPRHLLENILRRQVETCEAQRNALLKESVKGPSPYERAAEIAPTQPNATLMRRIQDTHFREVRRVTNLLLKIKRQARK
jgi:predicted transcriptional regulator